MMKITSRDHHNTVEDALARKMTFNKSNNLCIARISNGLVVVVRGGGEVMDYSMLLWGPLLSPFRVRRICGISSSFA